MDVSALNLGMIAAYYNISCKILLGHYLHIAEFLAFRCHRRSLQYVAQRKDKAERFT